MHVWTLVHAFTLLWIPLSEGRHDRPLRQTVESRLTHLPYHALPDDMSLSLTDHEFKDGFELRRMRRVLAGVLYATSAGNALRSRLGARVNIGPYMMPRKLKYKGELYKKVANVSQSRPRGIPHSIPYRYSSTHLKQGKDVQIRNLQGIRITGGTANGAKLETPSAYLRPMMSRVRGALFSMILPTNVLRESASCIDFFSGAGTAGLEALSRGVGYATLVDFSDICVESERRNIEKLRFEDRATVIQARTEDVLANPEAFGIHEPFELVMLTPPYEEVIYDDLMNAVANSSIVTEDTVVVVEYPVELGTLPQVFADGKLLGYRNRRYGRTVLAIYVVRPTGKLDEFERHNEEFVFENMGIAT